MNQNITYAQMVTLKFVVLLFVIALLGQCSSSKGQTDDVEVEYKEELTAKLNSIRSEDSLRAILMEFIEKDDDIGKIITCKHLGSRPMSLS